MTRRTLIGGAVALPLVKGEVLGDKALLDAALEFHEQYSAWVSEMRTELDNPGTVNWPARRRWESVRRAFHELDVVMRNR